MTDSFTHLFEAIDHVGIAVADLDDAIAFYRDTYGMTLAHEETNEEQGVREAMLSVGPADAPHSHIQLLAPLEPEAELDRAPEETSRTGYGLTAPLPGGDVIEVRVGRSARPGDDGRTGAQRHPDESRAIGARPGAWSGRHCRRQPRPGIRRPA